MTDVLQARYESECFIRSIHEEWGGSPEVPEAIRKVLGNFVALDIHLNAYGRNEHGLSTPRSVGSVRGIWTDESIGLVVGEPNDTYTVTTQVLDQPKRQQTRILEIIGKASSDDWQSQFNGPKRHNLGQGDAPYVVLNEAYRVLVPPNRAMRVYSRPVVFIDSDSTERFLETSVLVQSLGARVMYDINHPVRIP